MDSKVAFILGGLLVVVAFLLGRTWNQAQLLRSNQPTENNKQIAAASPTAAAPQVLGVQDQQNLIAKAMITKGNPQAKATMVEFSDYQCPFCARYATTTLKQIMETYGDKIYYVWHDFPLAFHQNASAAAIAARCAGEQGKYWEMHDELFANQSTWAESKDSQVQFSEYAGKVGLDTTAFAACVKDKDFKTEISQDQKLASQVGVNATPTFFINGQKISGAMPFETFKEVIDQALTE